MATATAADPRKKPAHPRDPAREAVETVVFVVVLVLLLKLFVTEAFVIPTGSMAETLYGYQKQVTCPKCGHDFPVNCHDEVEANQMTGRKHPLVGYTCPNCRYPGQFPRAANGAIDSPPYRSGDRVLVLKPIYHLTAANRGDVVVFKYPEEPQQKQTAQNYIKRAQGFGGETVGIHRGDLYVTTALTYPPDARDEDGNLLYLRPDDPKDLWKGDPARGPDYRYVNNKQAADLFEKSRQAGFPAGAGGFEIVRKPEDQLLADMRVVWDNDKQPTEKGTTIPPRWAPAPEAAGAWTADDPNHPRAFAHKGRSLDWLRYRHLIYPWNRPSDAAETKPTHVDNFLGYNAGVDLDPLTGRMDSRPNSADNYWVGDLILECDATFAGAGAVVLELSKGQNRFQARFGDGKVTLSSTGPGGKEFGSRPCKVKGPGKYRLRFANVDCRLWVWVDGKLIDFGTDADYSPASTVPAGKEDTEGYTEENDVAAPASIGAEGDVTVRAIKLFRDIYYTRGSNDHARADLYYVHPGHYLCLGDNSAQSSDSRKWGLVPERLMLGKAVFVFAPFLGDRWLSLRFDRIGFIK
ncbi:MAG: S26 family signal peptidase [Gemmataceae bacterium]|nr:S26 family signal peptidase [Gemmataceae bacterium]